ncbi:MAG: hypothetical protein LQ350_005468 [Teloschistes chrysophthalmus]|nr:MAG: hypothetical protein LQ350_005468 [Niorma chrysophthalma]
MQPSHEDSFTAINPANVGSVLEWARQTADTVFNKGNFSKEQLISYNKDLSIMIDLLQQKNGQLKQTIEALSSSSGEAYTNQIMEGIGYQQLDTLWKDFTACSGEFERLSSQAKT